MLDRHFLGMVEPLHTGNAKQRHNEGKRRVLAALTALEAALNTTVTDLLELEEKLNTVPPLEQGLAVAPAAQSNAS